MCESSHSHGGHGCFCAKICAVVKLLMAGIFLGTVAGVVAMYFFDRDKGLQYKAKKMIQSAGDLTRNIGSKIGIQNNDEE